MPWASRDPRHSWASGLSSSCREAGFARAPAIPARLRPPPNPWRRSIRPAGKEKPLFLANAGRTSNNEVENGSRINNSSGHARRGARGNSGGSASRDGRGGTKILSDRPGERDAGRIPGVPRAGRHRVPPGAGERAGSLEQAPGDGSRSPLGTNLRRDLAQRRFWLRHRTIEMAGEQGRQEIHWLRPLRFDLEKTK